MTHLQLQSSDQFSEYQQRHFLFCGKAALCARELEGPVVDELRAQVDGAKESGFPTAVVDALQQLFEAGF